MTSVLTIESRQHPLTSEVAVVKATSHIHRVFFGNSGLRINVMQDGPKEYRWIYHFTPNGFYQQNQLTQKNADEKKDKAIGRQHSLLLGKGLAALIDWWNNPFTWLDPAFPRQDSMHAKPTPELLKILQRLTPSYINGENLTIDLKGLAGNQTLTERIRRLSIACDQRNILMDNPVGSIPVY